jgi:excisionase family DNA binding protein
MKPATRKQLSNSAKVPDSGTDGIRSEKKAVLKVGECARELDVSNQHILNLIEEGQIAAINISSIGARQNYRIPVEEFQRYKRRRNSLNSAGTK